MVIFFLRKNMIYRGYYTNLEFNDNRVKEIDITLGTQDKSPNGVHIESNKKKVSNNFQEVLNETIAERAIP